MNPESNEQPKEVSSMSRRSALRLLTLTGVGLFAGGQSAQAFTDFFSSFGTVSPTVLKTLDVPTEWYSLLGSQLPAYCEYLKKTKLRYLPVREIIRPHTNSHGTVHNSLPPRSMWGNIRSTAKVIDALAHRLDHQIERVASAYRSPAYNARCPGAKSNSFHMRNNAIDIVFDCAPGKVAAMARAMKAMGYFKGGVGRYGGFTHIDTRGTNADW